MSPETPNVAVSVVMPVYNAAAYLSLSLAPLVRFLEAGTIHEVIVVDDDSTDSSVTIARQWPIRVLRNGDGKGVCQARNYGARQALGDIVWFIDADVVVHADAAARVRAVFADASVCAVIGSYDEQPLATNFCSQYKNLIHRYYHQREGCSAAHFWSGCGALRKSALLDVGGFDARRYPYPSIEDIELGYRLRDRGYRIILDRSLLAQHLKHWCLWRLLHTEIFRRAIPWSRLIVERGRIDNHFNISMSERLRALFTYALVFLVFLWLWFDWPLVVLIVLPAALGVAHFSLLKFFCQRRGLAFAIAGVMFHQLYYLYSLASFVAVWVTSARARPSD